MSAAEAKVLALLAALAILIAAVVSYTAVVSRNPSAQAKPLYAPTDFAPPPG